MRRLVLSILSAAGAALLLTACHGGEHHEFVVNTGADAPDAQPGDGVCEATLGTGNCTLRAAVDEANALTEASPANALAAIVELAETHAAEPPQVTITLATDVVLSRAGANEDANATGDLDIRADIFLAGEAFTVDGADLDRVLHVHSGALVVVNAVITGGSITDATIDPAGGGGIRAEAATTVTLVRTTVTANSATVGGHCVRNIFFPETECSPHFIAGGGGLWSAGTANIVHSTFSGNLAIPQFPECSSVTLANELCGVGFGGAVLSDGSGSMTVIASTFNGNGAFSSVPTDEGSAIFDNGAFGSVLLSTFVDNVPDPNEPVSGATVRGSILAGTGCADSTLDGGHNLVSTLPCPASPPGNPVVGHLADNGGATPTHLPIVGSPAVDAIPFDTPGLCDADSLPIDQRGRPRPVGAACDIGAVERQAGDP